MKRAIVKITGVSPYSQSRYHQTEKKEKEGAGDWEERTWRERMHINEEGNVIIPPMSFKNCIGEAAKFLSVQIPGKGKATYTKHFEAGVMVMDPMVLPIRKEDVHGEWLFVPASGRRGDGKRVNKCFPVIPQWGGTVEFLIIDDTINQEAFSYHIKQAGQLIGVGRFRPRNNGFYGRFQAEVETWEDYA
jgi:hypothetical protein